MDDDKSKRFTIDHLLGNTQTQPQSLLSSTPHSLPNNWPNLWQNGLRQPAIVTPSFSYYGLPPVIPLWGSTLWHRYPRLNAPQLPPTGTLWRPPAYWTANSFNLLRLTKRYPRKGGQIRFTHEQSNELESVFSKQRYLTPGQRKNLALKLELSERQVKTWFQNRRAKWRRVRQESTKQGESTSMAKEESSSQSEGETIEEEEEENEELEIGSETEKCT